MTTIEPNNKNLRQAIAESLGPAALSDMSDADIEQLLNDATAVPMSDATVASILNQTNPAHPSDRTVRLSRFAGSNQPRAAQPGSSKEIVMRMPNPDQPTGGKGLNRGSVAALVVSAVCLVMVLVVTSRPKQGKPGSAEPVTLAASAEKVFTENTLVAAVQQVAPQASAMVKAAIGDVFETKERERRRLSLPDGSVLFVNENTRLTLNSLRELTVDRGELFVEVCPQFDENDKREFFYVNTPNRKVTAIGTKFAVNASEDNTDVLVTQGKVQINGMADTLTAGRFVRFKKNDVELSVAPRASEALGWTEDLMVAAPIVPRSRYSGGALISVDPNGQEMKLSMRKYHVDVHIEDGFARTTIDQTYFNHMHSRLEGTFKFPLPADASLSRLAMYVGPKLMEGGMVERKRARDVFEQIVHKMKDPALLEWVDGTTFQMRVFPLEPRQEKRLVISYSQRLNSAYGKTHYRFPAGHNLDTVREWSTEILVKDGSNLAYKSPSHGLKAVRAEGDLFLTASVKNEMFDRDVVLEIQDDWNTSDMTALVASETQGTAGQANSRTRRGRSHPPLGGSRGTSGEGKARAASRDSRDVQGVPSPRLGSTLPREGEVIGLGGPRYRLTRAVHEDHQYLMLRHRPELIGDVEKQKRDWVFLFETSGDRNPVLARAQIEVIRTLLKNAEHEDTFNIVTAGTRPKLFRETGVACEAENIDAAIGWLEKSHLIGALDFEKGLKASVALLRGGLQVGGLAGSGVVEPNETVVQKSLNPRRKVGGGNKDSGGRASGDRERFLVHVGSGLAVLGQTSEKELVAEIPQSVRYVGVGVGKKWSRQFMKSAAARTGGYFTQINPDEKVNWRAFELLSVLNAPRLLNVNVTDDAERLSFLTYTESIAHGDEICAITRLPKDAELPKSLEVSGELNGKAWKQSVPVQNVTDKADYLPRSWARLEIDRLIADGAAQHKNEIVKLSKAMYVMSPFTSLLVLENEAMYTQHNVDRGRKDHWALYPAPATIKVVHEPVGRGLRRAAKPKNVFETVLKRDASPVFSVENVPSPRNEAVARQWRQLSERRKRFSDFDLGGDVDVNGLLDSVWVDVPAEFVDSDHFGRDFGVIPGVEKFGLKMTLAAEQLGVIRGEANSVRMMVGDGAVSDLLELSRVRASQAGEGVDQATIDRLRRIIVENGLSPDARLSEQLSKDWLREDRITNGAGRGFARGSRRRQLPLPEQLQRQWGLSFGRAVDGKPADGVELLPDFGNVSAVGGGGFGGGGGEPATVRYLDDFGLQDLFDLNGDGYFENSVGLGLNNDYFDFVPGSESRYRRQPESSLRLYGETTVSGGRPNGGPGAININTLRNPADLGDLYNYQSVAGSTLNLIYDGAQKTQLESEELSRGFQVDLDAYPFVGQAGTDRELFFHQMMEVPKYGDQQVLDTQGRPVQPFGTPRFEAQSWLSWPSWPLLPSYYREPDFRRLLPETNFLSDLIAHAPGLNSTRADLLSVIEAESTRKPKRGTVDDAARKLIERAHATGWETVTLGQGDGAVQVHVNGRGQFSWQRTVSEGLGEQVLCDGNNLWHLYEEIGLGAKREYSRFHRGMISNVAPWLVAPVEQLTIGADVLAVGERTVAIVPLGQAESIRPRLHVGGATASALQNSVNGDNADGSDEVVQKPVNPRRKVGGEGDSADSQPVVCVQLVFAKNGRLKERSVVRVLDNKTETLIRVTFGRNGTIKVLNGKDKKLAQVERPRVRSAEPFGGLEVGSTVRTNNGGEGSAQQTLQIDRKDLVILPLPYRDASTVFEKVGEHAEQHHSHDGDYSKWSEEDALALLATDAIHWNRQRMGQIVMSRFFKNGDTRAGLYLLIAKANPMRTVSAAKGNVPAVQKPVMNYQPNGKVSPAHKALVRFVRHLATASTDNEFDPSELSEGRFLHTIYRARNTYYRWFQKRAIGPLDKAGVAKEVDKAIAVVGSVRSPAIGWTILRTMQPYLDHSEFYAKFAEAAQKYEDAPHIAWFVRHERARALFKSKQAEEASKLYGELLTKTLKAGFVPAIDKEMREQFIKHRGQRNWTEMCRQTAAKLIEDGLLRTTIALSKQLRDLGDVDLANNVFEKAIAKLEPQKRPDVAMLAIQRLRGFNRRDDADKLLMGVLANPRLATSAQLWRYGSGLAEECGKTAEALRRLERAVSIEYVLRPDVINLQETRTKYTALLTRYEAIVDAAATLEQDVPEGLIGRIVRAADQWRSMEDDETQVCQLTARILTKLDDGELAWDYVTTPLATQPGSASWRSLGQNLGQQDQLDLAVMAYERAFEYQQTDPTILLEHATLLRNKGRGADAKSLLKKIVDGTWQPRFNNVKAKAQQLLR